LWSQQVRPSSHPSYYKSLHIIGDPSLLLSPIRGHHQRSQTNYDHCASLDTKARSNQPTDNVPSPKPFSSLIFSPKPCDPSHTSPTIGDIQDNSNEEPKSIAPTKLFQDPEVLPLNSTNTQTPCHIEDVSRIHMVDSMCSDSRSPLRTPVSTVIHESSQDSSLNQQRHRSNSLPSSSSRLYTSANNPSVPGNSSSEDQNHSSETRKVRFSDDQLKTSSVAQDSSGIERRGSGIGEELSNITNNNSSEWYLDTGNPFLSKNSYSDSNIKIQQTHPFPPTYANPFQCEEKDTELQVKVSFNSFFLNLPYTV
jgi:hypothetical protein